MLGIIASRIQDETILLPAVGRLVPLMDDDDMEVRDETAEVLGVIASRIKDQAAVKSAIGVLITGLSDKKEEVREESAEALARRLLLPGTPASGWSRRLRADCRGEQQDGHDHNQAPCRRHRFAASERERRDFRVCKSHDSR